ncbi:hypothetical protein LIER_16606 [Lithospermum erythrorhizon]|uniref:Reverse transcriptase domain-containing protein n=1 Tax=Lithospermum erythrorhizon TaxID=34254 RepID=A0AAV3Q7B6_LITER
MCMDFVNLNKAYHVWESWLTGAPATRVWPILFESHVVRLEECGATYQRMVNAIFKSQIGKNMEIYMDDMLIKSKK